MINKAYWKNKKVLVTGHTGFKGSWLSAVLRHFGSEVIGLSDGSILSDEYKTQDRKYIYKEEFTLDISDDMSDFRRVLSKHEIDTVFHLAAQGIVSTAFQYPLKTIMSNIIGTYNILDLVNSYENINSLVISTTDKVYFETSKENTEEDKLGGAEFYSASKASTEHIINAYLKTKKRNSLNVGVVRSGNVLGGGDGAKDRIMTDIINALKESNKITLRMPESIRPWQYILDSLTGYLLTCEYVKTQSVDEVFNLNSPSNNKYTVRNLTDEIVEAWKPDTDFKIKIEKSDLQETETLIINSNKANKLLNWSPKYEIKDIAEKIVSWEKSAFKGKNITSDQITDFYS